MRDSFIYIYLTLALAAAPTLSSCIYEDEPDTDADTGTQASIRITTAMVPGRWDKIEPGDAPFMLMLWDDDTQLVTPGTSDWSAPYLYRESPQSVTFYKEFVYDVGEPYPTVANQMLYATGYAPSTALVVSDNYRVLDYGKPDWSQEELKEVERIDFLGCDVWPDVYRGSVSDPFAQDKNRLYFRHLAAKLVFYADRERGTMEGRQYVRRVSVTNLRMSVDGGTTWEPLCAPVQFTWGPLDPARDFSAEYTALLDRIKKIPGNTTVTSVPPAGYRTSAVRTFTDNPGFVLQRRLADGSAATDRVPVTGMALDSCYVASPLDTDGNARRGKIELRMDITAELSFDFPFPLPDGSSTDEDGSVTDDMTFTHTWPDMTVDAIKVVDADGNLTGSVVDFFRPGDEYRVYIHFTRTGVNMVARQLPWFEGGSHTVVIVGGDKAQTDTDTPAPAE